MASGRLELAGRPGTAGMAPHSDKSDHTRNDRGTRTTVIVAVVLCVCALAGLAGWLAARGSPLPKPTAPETGALLGFWVRTDFGANPQTEAWRSREQDADRTFDIAHTFHPFEEEFPTAVEREHLEAGRTPLISWNGTYTSEIAAGDHDDTIRARARAVRDLGTPVFLRFFWEMDGANKADLAEDPDTYAIAWRRIRSIFEAEGATNAAFVWCPNAWDFERRETERWYPGDDVVDWVCADGYNWAPGRDGATWQSFDEIFAEFYEWAETTDKPIMIAEFGAQERAGSDKADWLQDAADTIETEYPEIKAVVYFDEDRRTRGHYDWRLDTSPESYAAWLEIARDPYFNTRG